MKITDDLKNECIERLKILKLDEKIVNDFINDNKVYATIMDRDVIEVTNYNIVAKLMKSFEQKNQVKIYHIISIEEEFRNVIYFLYVSDNSKEWKAEQEDLKRGFAEVSLYEEIERYDSKNIGITVNNGKIIKVV